MIWTVTSHNWTVALSREVEHHENNVTSWEQWKNVQSREKNLIIHQEFYEIFMLCMCYQLKNFFLSKCGCSRSSSICFPESKRTFLWSWVQKAQCCTFLSLSQLNLRLLRVVVFIFSWFTVVLQRHLEDDAFVEEWQEHVNIDVLQGESQFLLNVHWNESVIFGINIVKGILKIKKTWIKLNLYIFKAIYSPTKCIWNRPWSAT